MQFLSESVSDGVRQRDFHLHDITGILWSPLDPESAAVTSARPLILLGHGGGQHKRAPGIVARARRFSLCGFAVVAVDAPGHGDRPRTEHDETATAAIRQGIEAGQPTGPFIAAYNAELTRRALPEWRSVLDELLRLDGSDPDAPVGYWGLSLGGAIGLALVAAEPRITAAVVGLIGDDASSDVATRVTIPVQMVLQWDDEVVPRLSGLALFDALASSQKTLFANAGRHMDVPRFEAENAERFFVRNLVGARTK